MPLSILESPALSVAVFATAALAITLAGVAMSRTADRLADQTGWGEATMGVVFVAAATSLPDFAATITAAAHDRPALAMSNIMGSVAFNLAILGIADLVYRKANLEHAAASSANLVQATLLIAFVTLLLLAMLGPSVSVWAIHPVSIVVPIAYGFGIWIVRRTTTAPMWTPRPTSDTVTDQPEEALRPARSQRALWVSFAALTAVLAAAGWGLMLAAETIITWTGLSETLVGSLLTAIATSSPELVVTIAAIRRGALTLAVGSILGTNLFNLTAIATADAVYRGGSIHHAVATGPQMMWGLVAILMSAILLLGFVYRERYGIAKIGFESCFLLLVYAGAVTVLLVGEC